MNRKTLLALPVLLALAAGAGPQQQRPVDLRTQVQQLQAEVEELKSRIVRLEGLLTRKVGGAIPTPVVDKAAVDKALKDHQIVTGMTIEQVKQVLAYHQIPYEQSAKHFLVDGRDVVKITIHDATGEDEVFDEGGILIYMGR